MHFLPFHFPLNPTIIMQGHSCARAELMFIVTCSFMIEQILVQFLTPRYTYLANFRAAFSCLSAHLPILNDLTAFDFISPHLSLGTT